jgi:hypothetical protein
MEVRAEAFRLPCWPDTSPTCLRMIYRSNRYMYAFVLEYALARLSSQHYTQPPAVRPPSRLASGTRTTYSLHTLLVPL